MTTPGLAALVDDLANECFGGDWFDFRDRLEAWAKRNPAKAQDLLHFARRLLEEWDHEG